MPVKVLLVNPNREQMPWPVVPVGLCLVATAAERAGHRVQLVDLTHRRSPAGILRRAARRFAPDVVGIGVRNIDNCNLEHPVFYLPQLREMVRVARTAAPAATVVVGGAGVNIAPRAVLDYLEADFALVGEGEVTLPAFVAAPAAGRSLVDVPGAVARRGIASAGASCAPVRVPDLGRSPVSEAYRWVDLRGYHARGSSYPVQTKRGCSRRCSYCVYNAIEGGAYRLRSPEAVVDEVAEAVGRGRVTRVEIVDSTFNLPRDHALSVCETFASRSLPVRLTTMGLNPEGVSASLLAAMRRAGFDDVMCTAESASEVTLRSLGKDFDRRTLIETAALLRRSGLRTFWYFMLGAPGETMATARETLAFCEEQLPPTDVVHFTTGIRVYAGTPLHRRAVAEGIFRADDPLLEPSWYVSAGVDLGELYRALVRAAAAHPNWITNAETILGPRRARLVKGAFELVGWSGPFWIHLPKLMSLAGRIGARQRVLDANLAQVAAMGRRARNPR